MTQAQSIWFVFDLIGVLADPSWRDITTSRKNPWDQFKVGERLESEFWDAAGDADAYRALLAFRPHRLQLVRDVRAKGFHIAIATNFARSWLDQLFQKQPEACPLFDATIVSDEVRAAKPAFAFWQAVHKHAPSGSVVIDDKRENCEAAKAAGFRSIWAHPGVNLEAEVARVVEEIQLEGPPPTR
jgi:HAD superfamily hydrolase (TIGR01509 family)